MSAFAANAVRARSNSFRAARGLPRVISVREGPRISVDDRDIGVPAEVSHDPTPLVDVEPRASTANPRPCFCQRMRFLRLFFRVLFRNLSGQRPTGPAEW